MEKETGEMKGFYIIDDLYNIIYITVYFYKIAL